MVEWKRADLAFSSVLGDEPHPIWARDLAQVYFSARRENEVVFLHARTRTLLCADALLNISTHDLRATRLVARVIGNSAPGVGYLEPLMVRDRRLARRQVDRILEWEIEGAVLSHGALVPRDGREVVRRAYAWV